MSNKKMSPGEMKARTGKTKSRFTRSKGDIPLVGASAGLTAGVLAKAFKKAKELKPSGRINLDDLKRQLKPMKPSKPLKPKK